MGVANYIKFCWVVFVLVFISVFPGFSQEFEAKSDSFIKSEMQSQKIPGVALAVVKNGSIILAKGYGFSNVEHQIPVKPETIFQSGSVGKQFTATAVMMLVEDGKINLDEKISKYLGEVPDSWRNITVRHLLTHTSGMTDYPPDFDYRRDYTEDELLARAKMIPLSFAPGEKWDYSNLGYVVLGIVIRKASGKFYGDFLQERIFKPLGMANSRIISELDIVPNRSAGYQLIKGELKHQDWVSPTLNTTADGALYLTLYDMAKWDAALYTEKLLKKASLDQMWRPAKLNNGKTVAYGFGWQLRSVNGRKVVEHGGSWQGFKAAIARYPDIGLTVVVFANLAQADPEKLAHGIAGIYDPLLIAPAPKEIEDREPETTSMVRGLLKKLAESNASPEAFTEEARAALFPDAARSAGEFLKGLGELKAIKLIERKDQDGMRLFAYRADFKEGSLKLNVVFSPDGKIAGIEFRPA